MTLFTARYDTRYITRICVILVIAKAASFSAAPLFSFFRDSPQLNQFLVDITFANSRMGPRNRGGRPTLSQGLDREVSGLDLRH